MMESRTPSGLAQAVGNGEDVEMPDQLLPQPPPDAPASPAGEHALRSRRKMGWMLGGGVISMICAMMLPAAYDRYRTRGPDPAGEAFRNARSFGFALFEFDMNYGRFPNDSTGAEVKGNVSTSLTLAGRTSNDLFAQLIAAEICQSESLFYANAKSMRKPDNVFRSDATILEHGECAFAYVCGLTSKDDPTTPIAFGPVIPGTKNPDTDGCDGKAVVLRIDNTVTYYPLNSSGKIILPNGLDLLDPRQPFWHGKTPDVRWPK